MRVTRLIFESLALALGANAASATDLRVALRDHSDDPRSRPHTRGASFLRTRVCARHSNCRSIEPRSSTGSIPAFALAIPSIAIPRCRDNRDRGLAHYLICGLGRTCPAASRAQPHTDWSPAATPDAHATLRSRAPAGATPAAATPVCNPLGRRSNGGQSQARFQLEQRMLALPGDAPIVKIADRHHIGNEHEIKFAPFRQLRTFDVVTPTEPAIRRRLRQAPCGIVIADAADGEAKPHLSRVCHRSPLGRSERDAGAATDRATATQARSTPRRLASLRS